MFGKKQKATDEAKSGIGASAKASDMTSGSRSTKSQSAKAERNKKSCCEATSSSTSKAESSKATSAKATKSATSKATSSKACGTRSCS